MKRVIRGVGRFLRRGFPFAVLAAIVLGALCYPRPKTQTEAEERIVLIWNVDTFEGGKGSRASFLSRVARLTEKRTEGVYYRVVAYTAEGARAAMAEGEYPDVLSFGVGLDVDESRCETLPYAFAGSRLAVPWCRGGYYLFSRTEDGFTEDSSAEGETVISVGGSNLACAAAYFSGIRGEEKESLAAYLAFLGGECRYLLGTQRDVCRFAARGETVYAQELEAYCDLYQYVSIFSKERRADCLRFLGTLFSAEVQGMLSDIGMRPAAGATGRTVSVFSSSEELAAAARALRQGGTEKIPENFFESV